MKVLGVGASAEQRVFEEGLEGRRGRVLGVFVEGVGDREEDVRLGAKVVDYLQENVLMRS